MSNTNRWVVVSYAPTRKSAKTLAAITAFQRKLAERGYTRVHAAAMERRCATSKTAATEIEAITQLTPPNVSLIAVEVTQSAITRRLEVRIKDSNTNTVELLTIY